MSQFLKLALLIVLNSLILICIAFSQTNTKYFSPVVSPSPTAADLGKFGNLPVNLSTGAVTVQIPLYEFGLKNNLNLSMNLNYSTNGVLVDANVGLNGTNWSFAGEYCIRRTVSDDPDETSEDLTKALDGGFNAPALNRLIAYGSTIQKDFQPDLFTLVAPGFQGNFFLSGDSAVFLNQNTSFKAKMIFGYGFKVSDGKGNIYMFGGDAIESSKTIHNCAGDGYHPDATFVPTAWFLKSITTPGKETVNYTYSGYTYTYFLTPEITDVLTQRTIAQTSDACGCPIRDMITCTNMVTTNTFKLEQIVTSDKLKITFGYDNKLENISDYLMTEINVLAARDSGSMLLRKVKMQYSNGAGKKRQFLSKVSVLSGSLRDSMVYRLYYNNLDQLPDRGDLQTDAWGYYNASVYPTPNPIVSRYGTLSRIVYPTGGYTNFEYENNTVASNRDQQDVKRIGSLLGYGIGDHSPQKYTLSQTLSKLDNTILRIAGSCSWNFSGAPDYPAHRMEVEIRNATTNKLLYSTSLFPGNTLSYKEVDITDIFANNQSIGNLAVSMTCYGEYLYGQITVDQLYTYPKDTNLLHGGVRLIKEEDVSAYGKTGVKKYSYNKFNSQLSSGEYVGYLDFEEELYTENHCPDVHIGDIARCYAKLKHNKSLMNLFAYSNAPVYYKNVTESLGENGENGSIKHEFDIMMPLKPVGYQTAYTGGNSSSFSMAPFSIIREQTALEKRNEYYSNSADGPKLVKSETFEYSAPGIFSKHRTGYAYRTMILGNDDVSYPTYFTSYDVISFSLNAGWVGIKTKVDTLYDLTGKSIATSTTYNYGAIPANSNVTSIESTNSKGEKITTNYKYANAYTGQVYDSMIQRNMLDPVIEQSRLQNGLPVEKILTEYAFTNGINSQIQPYKINIQNGNGPLELRYVFNLYDEAGNVLERNMPGNINEVYLWGYDNQLPVAKIMGSNYNTVKALVSNVVLQSPSSNAQLRNELNLLRQKLPADILLNYYTYDPHIGITSETDPSGKTVFYEYDSFGRLKLVKDQNGKILKQFNYQYQQAVTQ